MHRRNLVTAAALAFTSLALAGCPDEGAGPSTGPTSKPTTRAAGTGAGTGAASSAKPTTATTGTAAAPSGATGSIKGVVNFAGKPLEMKSPTKRKEAELCKDKDVPYNAVLVKDGKLQDVFVKVLDVKGKFDAPKTKAEIDQKDCMYTPRIQGVVAGQEIDIKNGDATLHNVHTYKGTETLFNQAQPKGAPAITKSWDDSSLIRFACDVHPWMRGFVVVHDNPFFAVSGADGSFTIDKVPVGKYDVEAWHSQYGVKKGSVEVAEGKAAELKFDYSDKDEAPAENKDELKGLW
jgi:plastocyanin